MTLLGTSARARVFGPGVGAVASQGSTAAGNLVLQVLAARALGASGFGSFTIFIAVLVLLAALVGGWVGDSRTVLDRSDRGVRGALTTFQVGFTVIAAVGGCVGCWATGLTNGSGVLIFGVLSALWVTEDLGRRLLAARLEFWAVVANDVVYLVAALVAVLGLKILVGSYSLNLFLGAMAMGAAAAVLAARFQLPRQEFNPGRPDRSSLRLVASFGSARSAQVGLRPLTTVVLRSLVKAFASAAALGQLEAARLVVSPVLLVINGVGSFLLPFYTRRRVEDPGHPPSVSRLTWALAGVTSAYGVLVTVFATSLVPLVTGGTLAVDRWAIAGWSLFAVAFGLGVPTGNALLARRRSWLVLQLRLIDSALGLSAALVLIAAIGVFAAPFGLAAGAAVGALLLWAAAKRVAAVEPAGKES